MKILNFVFLVLFSLGCTNALEEEVFSDLSPSNFYKSEKDAEAAVMAIYNGMNRAISYYDFQMTSLTYMPAPHTVTRVPFRKVWSEYSFDSSEPGALVPYWRQAYLVINRANTAIDRIPGIDMDPEKKAALIAEAKWLRAYNYFNLVRFFGDIPLLLKETTSLADANPSRTSMDQVYQAIIVDLKAGEKDLPPVRPASEKGRITSGAAKFLLAKVHLTMAGKPTVDASKWAEAHTLFKELIDNKDLYEYGLEVNYADIFDVGNELSQEIIFAVQQSQAVEGQGTAMSFVWTPPQSPFSGPNGQYHGGFTRAFYESYEPNDIRRDITMIYSYTHATTGDTIVFGQDRPYKNEKFGIAPGKYKDPDQNCCDGDPDIIVYRYADALLMFAEAENELNGPTAEAFNYLNMVRERANASLYDPNAGWTKEDFRELIYQERFWELSFEFHEIFDIRRMGKVKETIEQSPEAQEAGTVYDPKFELFPIPLSEIQTNPNIKQNPGY